jgi:hypothetical protein
VLLDKPVDAETQLMAVSQLCGGRTTERHDQLSA